MKQSFPIVGMHCAGCANNLTKAISKVPGVISVTVTYTTEKAMIEFDEHKIDWELVKKAASSIGSYQIVLPQKKPEMDHSQMDHSAPLKEKAIKVLKTKTIISGVLTLTVVIGSVLKFLPHEIAFIITAITMAYSGQEFFINAFKGLKSFTANMDTLIAMGTGAAFIYSTVVTFFPQLFETPQPVYYETAGAIITLIILGRYLEAVAKGKASQAIKKLLGLQAKKAIILESGKEVEINISDVQKGDHLIVKPGAKVPVDGIVIKGQSYLDEALVTGESMPVKKQVNDSVIGSTINKNGLLVIKATNVGSQTMLAQIVKLVEEAQSSQAPIQKLADKISGIFVPSVIIISLLAFLVWYFLLGLTFSSALVISITILIVSCPCALGLATPISIMVGTGRGAKAGILIKDAEKLQIAGNIKAVVFDKTGTLTEGNFKVTDIVPADIKPIPSQNDILFLASSLEKGSEHPIGEALVEKAKGLKLINPQNFKIIEGKGISGQVNAKNLLLGTQKLMEESQVLRCAALDENISQLKNQGKTIAYLAVDKKTIGAVALEDSPKKEALEVIQNLKNQGLKVIMITGDNKETGQAIAKRLGINQVLAEVLPQDKEKEIKKLKEKYEVVAMVGDGVNDAPALAQANIGIAMATGTDVAIEAGDITLLGGQIDLIDKAITLSKKTMTNIKQNLFWAFGYNSLLIPIAAGVLKPVNITISPIFASGAMAFSSLSVILNALRLKKVKL